MFESFSTNAEDVLLWRTLQHIPNGFWVDVGCEDPELGSDTCAFYRRGWHGINIDPVPHHIARQNALRPGDYNFCCACGTGDSTTLYTLTGTHGIDSISEEFALRNQKVLGGEILTNTYPVRRLDSIIDEVNPAVIHFLKIDVEGSELEVLKSIDLQRIRPWIILLEAVEPQTRAPSHKKWEPLLLSNNYRFSYFDGLNRYYISSERFEELNPNLSVQPNVFDGYRRVF